MKNPPVNPAVKAEDQENWHTRPSAEVARRLGTDASAGLSHPEASKRLAQHGPNELKSAGSVSPWALLAGQFKNVLIVILIAAVILSAALGHTLEAVAIGVIIAFAVLLGFVQEFRAERAIEALRRMAAPLATVIRAGREKEIPSRALVPGDVVVLHAGNRVPADLRLTEAMNLKVEEAALTGESVPVDKSTAPLPDPALPLGDRKNMVYAGTLVAYGRGKGIVVATGMTTEFGKITGMLQAVETGQTPLQENLERVGKTLAKAALAVVAVIVGIGLLRGQPLLEMVIFGIALAVAVVPEALPAVVTISLAIGVQRMVRRNALIRRLPIVEVLGSTTVICSDKTGTLTKDEMTIRRLATAEGVLEVTGAGYEPAGAFLQSGKSTDLTPTARALLRGGALCSDAVLVRGEGDDWDIKGDPTEGAFVVAAAKAGFDKSALDDESPRIDEIPFSSETKRMTTLHRSPDGTVAFTKGAPEVVLTLCVRRLTPDGPAPLDENARREILAAAEDMARNALRVLALSTKSGADIRDADTENTFVGLVGMIDPPRPEAKDAIKTCESAGVRPVMITGDHPSTAAAIARELGILKNDGKALTGMDLEAMDEETLRRESLRVQVYARVSPAHKLRIVSALQDNGHVAAMTGDGVNDAPALKKADIGIAMGITGTDVSKEVAGMILTDDNFASIVSAVEEGRGVFDNIKKYLMYLLSSNVGEILLMAGATLLGLPLPLTAVQILYVNLATDGLPALALAVDPPDPDLMRRKPRNARTGIFTRPVIVLMLVGGIWSAIVNIGVFHWALNSGMPAREAVTMTFVSLVLIQFFKAYNYRSDRVSVFRKPFANKWLNLAIFWELILLAVIVYWAPLQKPFETFSLPAKDWVLVGGLSLTVVPVLETAKWMARKGWFDGHGRAGR